MHKTPEKFDLRSIKVKDIEFLGIKQYASVGEVWRYYEGINIGNEISKDGAFQRPCIVLKNNLGNGLLLVIPLTTKFHAWMKKCYFQIDKPERFGIIGGYAILNQTKLIDSKRLIQKLSPKSLSKEMIQKILQSYFAL